MNTKEKIDFIDETLAHLEDFTKGQDGDDITMSRKYLDEIKQKLLSTNITTEKLNKINKRIDDALGGFRE